MILGKGYDGEGAGRRRGSRGHIHGVTVEEKFLQNTSSGYCHILRTVVGNQAVRRIAQHSTALLCTNSAWLRKGGVAVPSYMLWGAYLLGRDARKARRVKSCELLRIQGTIIIFLVVYHAPCHVPRTIALLLLGKGFAVL